LLLAFFHSLKKTKSEKKFANISGTLKNNSAKQLFFGKKIVGKMIFFYQNYKFFIKHQQTKNQRKICSKCYQMIPYRTSKILLSFFKLLMKFGEKNRKKKK